MLTRFISISNPLTSIPAVRNKVEDIVRQKPCFWEENLLTLCTIINICARLSKVSTANCIKENNKWLGEQLGKDKVTVSKWCTNTCQPDLGSLMRISKLLEVEVTDLLREDNID